MYNIPHIYILHLVLINFTYLDDMKNIKFK